MSREIVARYTLSESLCLAIDGYNARSALRWPFRWAMNTLMWGLIALAVALRASIGRDASFVTAFMILYAKLWLSSPLIRRWRVRRLFRRNPEAGMPITWIFFDDGFHVSSPIASSTKVWSSIAALTLMPTAFVLTFKPPRRKFYVPKSIYLTKDAFDPDDLDAFVALVSWKLNGSEKMKVAEGELP